MHRMCQIIHTDFKPENVVICLRDSEIQEIQKTGQLTTTKMGKNEHIKNMNMKVAGTLGNYLNQRVNSKTGELEKVERKDNKKGSEVDKTNDESMISKQDSDKSKSTCNNESVWDKDLFEGLNSKQKKNLRKKL